jgi:hypothetical protein
MRFDLLCARTHIHATSLGPVTSLSDEQIARFDALSLLNTAHIGPLVYIGPAQVAELEQEFG